MSRVARVEAPEGYAVPVPRPAATVIMIRPGRAAPLEAFLQMRHEKMDFAPGVLVFPGGRVDAADSRPDLLKRVKGASSLTPADAVLMVAAIRETFEECGVLIARPRGGAALIDAARAGALAGRRAQLNSKTLSFPDFVEAEDLELAGDLIRPFARWITPWWNAKRFDTHFFLLSAPEGQTPTHDGGEAVESIWLPLTAACIADTVAKDQLMPPTLRSLQKLAEARSLDAMFGADASHAFSAVEPWMERHETGFVLMHRPWPDHPPMVARAGTLSQLGMNRELAERITAKLVADGWPA